VGRSGRGTATRSVFKPDMRHWCRPCRLRSPMARRAGPADRGRGADAGFSRLRWRRRWRRWYYAQPRNSGWNLPADRNGLDRLGIFHREPQHDADADRHVDGSRVRTPALQKRGMAVPSASSGQAPAMSACTGGRSCERIICVIGRWSFGDGF
jgi:hypothetical protein